MTERIENIMHPWSSDEKTILLRLQANAADGLSSSEARGRLEFAGLNKIELSKETSLAKIFFNQFTGPFVMLLGAGAIISFYFRDWLDGIAITAVIFINAIVGFIMEFQAGRAMHALRKLTTVPARVMRDGALIEISSEQVVPGDLLFVESGDMIAADARLIRSSQLQTDESALTGESLPVEKYEGLISKNAALAERGNMLYKGTFVSNGNGYAVVVQTGMSTEFGSIARMVQTAEQAATPLEKKIQSFSKKLIWITIGLVIFIFIAGLLNGQKLFQMLQTSIALSVAAIPEGLPIVATLALAFGMLRMARHHVIVKKLSSVETLGGTNVICTDKTGTLTENNIEASFIEVHAHSTHMRVNSTKQCIDFVDDASIRDTAAYQQLFRIAALCNTASYHVHGSSKSETGDPLEIALLKMVNSDQKKPEQERSSFPKEDELPFSSDTKVMATLHRNGDKFYIAAKGAVEELLTYCTSVVEGEKIVSLTDHKRNHWLQVAESKAASGLRMLAFAFADHNKNEKEFLHDLTLAGLVGFIDPPRPEVPAAIAECESAGIKVVMVTGDHPATAKNIAMQLGLARHSDKVINGKTMKAYHQLSKEDKEKWLQAPVFARVTPAQKLDIVTLFQERKMVVGMTGDGVNDAPALQKADIGIAMGQRGVQVAQEVADMVLQDDAFSSIVLAIKQGRVIFDNIRKFVIFLLSCNVSELMLVATAAVLNLHFQLLPLQILFINLITDVLPALALGLTEAAPNIMQRKPYSSGTPIIDRKRWSAIFAYSAVIALTTLAAVFTSHELLYKRQLWDADLCNNILFYTLIFSQMLHVFNMSFGKVTAFHKSEVFRNRYVWYALFSCLAITIACYWIAPVQKVLHLYMYHWRDWSIVIAFSFLSVLIIQFMKRMRWII